MAVAKELRGHITTPEMELAIVNGFDPRKNYHVPNVTAGLDIYEVDLLMLRPTDYAVEFEIKLTKSDLMKDFKKDHDHVHELIKEVYFVVPMNIVSDTLRIVPPQYGVIGVHRIKNAKGEPEPTIKIVRETTPNESARKWTTEERIQLMRLGNMRYWNVKKQWITCMRTKHQKPGGK